MLPWQRLPRNLRSIDLAGHSRISWWHLITARQIDATKGASCLDSSCRRDLPFSIEREI
jgi:hypothetical protein